MIQHFAKALRATTLRHLIKKTWMLIKRFISKHITRHSPIDMWRKRATQYGPRAALNIGHPEEKFNAVTKMQKEKIFPFLKQVLTGHEKLILDFGCGPGRFTPDLAQIIKGNAIGVDPIQDFLKMAPKHKDVEYRLMKKNAIPAIDGSIDVIWICLVLGGIIDKHALEDVISETDRILKNGGIITLIENTTDTTDREHWKYRPIEFYQSLFSFSKLDHVSDYYDLGERISILVGRKDV